jgi:hypothetical protein
MKNPVVIIIVLFLVLLFSWGCLFFLSNNTRSIRYFVRKDKHRINNPWTKNLSLEKSIIRHLQSYEKIVTKPEYIPSSLDETLADISEPFNHRFDVPFFWQIPKAGTTYALAYLSRCLNLTQATRKGQYSTDSVREDKYIMST